MLSYSRFNRSLCAASFFLCATSAMQAQELDDSDDLTPSRLAILRRNPPLVAASLLHRWGFQKPGDDREIQIDEKLHVVRFKHPQQKLQEFVCDRFEDGRRRTFPGTRRIEVSSQCAGGEVGPDGRVSSPGHWNVVAEKEGDDLLVHISILPDDSVFVGTLLPTRLPNWLPDLSTIDGKLLEVVGFQQGQRKEFQMRMKVSSRLTPPAFIAALNLNGEKQQGADSVKWDRKFQGMFASTAKLRWKASGDETVYYFSFRSNRLAADTNVPE